MIAKAEYREQSISLVIHIVNNDEKPGIRITVERVSVTTIRTRLKKVYCEICLRSLEVDEVHLAPIATEPREVTQPPSIAIGIENEKGEIE